MSDPHGDPRDDVGGDAVCWLHRLCPDCGAVPTPEVPGRCWRCGTVLADPRADQGRVQGPPAG